MKRVSFGVLPNGFRFYTQYSSQSHVGGIGVKAGSIHDPPNFRGMAHLTEHLLGTLDLEKELKLEEYMCGPDEEINVRTNFVSTFYGCGLILRREHVLDIFDMFASRLANPAARISEENIDGARKLLAEQAAVHNEYFLRGKDLPEDELLALVNFHMYETNPARNRVDCEPEELRSIRVGDMRKFVRSYYVAGNMFAVLLNIPFRKTRKLVEKYFGDLPAVGPPKPPTINEIRPALSGGKRIELCRPGTHQFHVAIAFPTWPYGHKDDIALDLLSEILRFRLRWRLRCENIEWEKGVYRAYAFTEKTFAHGMVGAYFATLSKDFAERGIEIILEECQRLKSEWVPNNEIVAMHNKLYNLHFDAFENSMGELCEMIIDAVCNGDDEVRGLNSYVGSLSRVGKKTLIRVANEYLDTKNHLQVIIAPS